ncbi:hypothetical protein M409DRAFT_58202 [Zasmidium cellare ATCC 36951]|uniref:Uncharacterized protein n=1 Tax=Zasmidium cellare ATCC 36951 TaxID=1080233 RepID=A0A6A6C866_ZASCE|nr:uncharacterized protein M409DRAFT_58202 [Zasmidium cellare ATCC 36951]KAF2162430.1 hypothetical protein M409DRAFT_58202 [Zasmidium cellare ATCC 36951]
MALDEREPANTIIDPPATRGRDVCFQVDSLSALRRRAASQQRATAAQRALVAPSTIVLWRRHGGGRDSNNAITCRACSVNEWSRSCESTTMASAPRQSRYHRTQVAEQPPSSNRDDASRHHRKDERTVTEVIPEVSRSTFDKQRAPYASGSWSSIKASLAAGSARTRLVDAMKGTVSGRQVIACSTVHISILIKESLRAMSTPDQSKLKSWQPRTLGPIPAPKTNHQLVPIGAVARRGVCNIGHQSSSSNACEPSAIVNVVTTSETRHS